MSYPKRADHFKAWSEMMLKQAVVPDRLQYKSTSKNVKGMNSSSPTRRKRFRRRKRRKKDRHG